ncbi:hypothetical protein KIN20_007972 [Parelaphostrongylus tenuis]|uniref:Uncharacterized protein n=1 Tax=Parelaphostrongylus tenuis TaxID=148309 RepID=A0AAD5QMD8_PARTN|nr:hypothetical protein KIN20_007972 [Parelaphostrongylus tenuis]
MCRVDTTSSRSVIVPCSRLTSSDMQPMCRGQNAHHRQIQPMCRVDYNLFAEAVIVPCSRLTSS